MEIGVWMNVGEDLDVVVKWRNLMEIAVSV